MARDDWSMSGLEKDILHSQEIPLASLPSRCVNKFLKETNKILSYRTATRNTLRVSFANPAETNDPNAKFQGEDINVQQNNNNNFYFA